MVTFTIPGNPVALKRHRHTRSGFVYNPQKEEMATTALMIKGQCSGEIFTGQVAMSVVFYMKIPASYSKKKKQQLIGKPHIKTPDCDNLFKFLLDATTKSGAVFKDDAQVYYLCGKKIYSDNPRTVVRVNNSSS